ncbi:MAG: CoA transferase [Patulibacter minatonensis]
MTAIAGELWAAIGGDVRALERLDAPGLGAAPAGGVLPSSFAVEDFAVGAFAALGLAASEWSGSGGAVRVDAHAATTAVRSEQALRVDGAAPGPVWDPLSTVYPTADGWVRLHANYAQHRAAVERVLGSLDPAEVTAKIATQEAEAVEAALHRAGGVAAAARTLEAWAAHPHGRTVTDRPLVLTEQRSDTGADGRVARPRVLELTRVIAGPTAGRALAWFGADVLRIEAPDHDELDVIVADFGAGKRSVQLDLREPDGRLAFLDLLAGADVFLHGVRPGALERLGLGAAERAAIRPGLIDASLSAYGATGGWAGRRGFDSLVQLSAGLGVAEALAAGGGLLPGLGGAGGGVPRLSGRSVEDALPAPRPLPCQLLDHATGLLLGAAILRALAARADDGRGRTIGASLARTAAQLARHGGRPLTADASAVPAPAGTVELVGELGTTLHAPVPVSVDGLAGGWLLAPPVPGSGEPRWLDEA